MKYLKIILLILFTVNVHIHKLIGLNLKKLPAPIHKLRKSKSFVLDNGLKVIVVENNKLPRAYTNLDIDNYPDYEGRY